MASFFKYGLITAAATSAWLLLAWALGLHSRHIALGHYFNYGAEIVLALALWQSLRAHLREKNYYWLPVWRGLIHGMATAFVAAIALSTFLTIYLNVLNREYPYLHLEWIVSGMRTAGQPEEQVRAVAQAYRWSTSPFGLPLTIIGTYLIFGFIASPLITLWLNWRRKESGNVG